MHFSNRPADHSWTNSLDPTGCSSVPSSPITFLWDFPLWLSDSLSHTHMRICAGIHKRIFFILSFSSDKPACLHFKLKSHLIIKKKQTHSCLITSASIGLGYASPVTLITNDSVLLFQERETMCLFQINILLPLSQKVVMTTCCYDYRYVQLAIMSWFQKVFTLACYAYVLSL